MKRFLFAAFLLFLLANNIHASAAVQETVNINVCSPILGNCSTSSSSSSSSPSSSSSSSSSSSGGSSTSSSGSSSSSSSGGSSTSTACTLSTYSELDLSNLQLHMPYTQYNGVYYDVTFNHIGLVDGKLTWQIAAADIESPTLPSNCSATVSISNNMVALTELKVKNSDITYTANLALDLSGSAILLKLVDYSEVASSSGGTSSSEPADELKLLLVVAGSDSTVTLAWTAYTANSTVVSEMLYHIHLSTDEGFEPDSSTLFNTLQGQAQTEISGLNAGTKYYIIVVAEDSTGASLNSNSLTATTFSTPVVIDSSVTFEKSEDLLLGEATATTAQLTFTTTSQTSLPAVNTLLAGETADSGYLRWVDSISQSGSTVQITTRDASLNEIISTGRLNSEVLLQDLSDSTQTSLTRKRTWYQLDNSRISHLAWDNGLLDITQIEHATIEDGIQIQPGDSARNYRIKLRSTGKRSSSNEVTVDAEITFNPTLATDIDWSLLSGVKSASVATSGTLGIEVKASYDFEGSVEFKPDQKRLLTKTFRAKYLIGGVPVWQVTTLTLDVQISATASSEIKASSTAKASASFGFGSNYLNGSWSTFSNPVTTSRSLTADISVNGKVEAEVRLIPNIKTKFYQAISGNISVEPFINDKLEAQALSNSDLLAGLSINYVQPTAFNIDLGLECYMSVQLTKIFSGISLLDKTKICGKDTFTGDLSYALFALPELGLTQNENTNSESTDLLFTGTAKNGTNNDFDNSSAQWFISPEGPILSVTNNTTSDFSSKMSFTPAPTVDKYTIFFSGNGVLGEIGRQYKQLEVNLSCEHLAGSWILMGKITATVTMGGESQTETLAENDITVVSVSDRLVTFALPDGSTVTGTCAQNAKSIVLDPPSTSYLEADLLDLGVPVTSITPFEAAVISVPDENTMIVSGPGSVSISTTALTVTVTYQYDFQMTR